MPGGKTGCLRGSSEPGSLCNVITRNHMTALRGEMLLFSDEGQGHRVSGLPSQGQWDVELDSDRGWQVAERTPRHAGEPSSVSAKARGGLGHPVLTLCFSAACPGASHHQIQSPALPLPWPVSILSKTHRLLLGVCPPGFTSVPWIPSLGKVAAPT